MIKGEAATPRHHGVTPWWESAPRASFPPGGKKLPKGADAEVMKMEYEIELSTEPQPQPGEEHFDLEDFLYESSRDRRMDAGAEVGS